MRYRMTFAVGMAIGYVLGSRAGRERYEQIKRAAQRVADSPRFQETAGVVGAQASKLAGAAREKVGGTLQQRIPFLGSDGHKSGTGSGWPEEEDLADRKARESGIPY
ncbi:MAG: YtxH domain-containing protein [Nonomuraea sp.]|nr:YtxH domain-containing protein [Nonomuraea sp.]NUP62887.1 YtxH domain-containing protein [Nonomuraea sp.]NUP83826.1 YtxH domain-containing protein [Nonomuraea sp.]NUS08979.1 YtxH domain-containing protein [Nonomuraea sp.]NUT41345.1 YtxH domain-containing protein [Thermoactinospora sp.]